MSIFDFIDLNFGNEWQALKPANVDGLSILIFETTTSFTLLTLGISHHDLTFEDGTSVRQELFLTLDDKQMLNQALNFIINFSEVILAKHQALYDNEKISYKTPIFKGTDFYSFSCVVSKVYFSEDIEKYVNFMKITPL